MCIITSGTISQKSTAQKRGTRPKKKELVWSEKVCGKANGDAIWMPGERPNAGKQSTSSSTQLKL